MAKYQLSRRAATDIDDIADYSIEQFGIKQARRYGQGLETCFQILAENPRQKCRAVRTRPQALRAPSPHCVLYSARLGRANRARASQDNGRSETFLAGIT